MAEMNDLELLNALGVDLTPQKKTARTAREERIIAGFEEIERFVARHGRLPQHGEDKDIFERIYAVRLDRMRQQQECRDLLEPMDKQGLLGEWEETANSDAPDDAELLAQLGIEPPREGDVTFLKHVRPRAESRVVDEVANRIPCEDFEPFRVIFAQAQKALLEGSWQTTPFRGSAEIRQGELFILSGQKVYVAEIGAYFLNQNKKRDSRLRVIYDNGTESDILLRSLQRALNKDEHSRRVVKVHPERRRALPRQDHETEDDGEPCSSIYVLRSRSDHPMIASHREVIHKIGVTGGDVSKRIANARMDPTFLMAEVDIVATYTLSHMHGSKLESLIHGFFESARLEIEIRDRFGQPVTPREWFLVPLSVIDEVMEKIRDGSISHYTYDRESASLLRVD